MTDAVHVLLVEDDPVDAQLLRESLHTTDLITYRIDHATSLAEARARLAQTPRPDVVLLDLGLQDSRGLDTFERLLAGSGPVPVVVLTGLDDDIMASAAVEAGAQDYLVKGSVTGEVMARVVRHAIDRYRLQMALRERVKEQAGLFAISQTLHVVQSASDLCVAVSGHLVGAMQRPARCHATVTLGDHHGSAGTTPAVDVPTLTASVTVDGAVRGHLAVGYSEACGDAFLPEEQQLLHSAADAIAGWLARRDALHQLARQEERLGILVAQPPGAVWTTDGDLRISTVGGAALANLGIEAKQLVGTPIVDLFATDPPSKTQRRFTEALAGDTVVFEGLWRGRWWRVLVEPQRDPGDRIIGTVVITLDITAERQHRTDLDASRERFKGLWVNASEAMILADDGGNFVDANPAASELTGYDKDELLDLQIWRLTGDGGVDEESAPGWWRQLETEGAMAGEFPVRRKDGAAVETDFTAVANIVAGVHLISLRDITARMESEAALAASETRFRAIAESSQDAIYRLRLQPDVTFEYLNHAVEDITGFPSRAFTDDPSLLQTRTHPDDAAHVDPSAIGLDMIAAEGFRFQHADGHWIWLEDRRSLVMDNGRVVGVQGVIRDVTAREKTEQSLRNSLVAEQQALEQLRVTDKLKSSFLQAVSHELRTPLMSILGYARTLDAHADRLSTDQVADFHRRLVGNATRLEQLLGDLLDVGRLDDGTARLDLQPADLTELARRVAETVVLGDRELVLDDTPAAARVDVRKVERIIHNLLANAAKHTPPGSTVWVACATTEESAVLTISDNGSGIPTQDHEHVFDPFWQGPAMRRSPSPGTGIGLSLVRQFATLHGGDVRVDDRPGGGTIFRVTLPLIAPEERQGRTIDRHDGRPFPDVVATGT